MEPELKMDVKKILKYVNQSEIRYLLNSFFFLIFIKTFSSVTQKTRIPNEIFEIFHMMEIILTVFCLAYILIIILQAFNKQISRSSTFFVISVLLICFFYAELKETSLNSISYTLSLIISAFCIRYVFFRFYLYRVQKKRMDESLEHFIALLYSYVSLYIVYFIFICYPTVKFFQLNIFLMILVYGFYDLVKVKYLFLSPEYSEKSESDHISFFNEIKGIDMYAWLIVLIMFLLYNYKIFNVSDTQTLYYFHSAVSQIFAAILGIVSMFGILILQKKENETKNNILKKGIEGFLIIYLSVIILSITGILVSRDITFESLSAITWSLNMDSTTKLISSTIFELSFLMTPIALLYLYAMIVNFLKFDDT